MNTGSKEWFGKAIIYHIFIDRFAGFKSEHAWNKPRFIGGNITGIIDKIPYLSDLGINTILLSPFYKTVSYHGYHIVDYFKIDPNYGTLNDIKNLIAIAASKNINIIIDFVPNHCSVKHPFFEEAVTDKKSPYHNWFFFKKWPEKYICFLHYKELPKLNLKNPETAGYIIDAADYWLSLGFKGLRVDHVIGLPVSFLKKFINYLNNKYPESVILGEAWGAGLSWKELKTVALPNKYWSWLRKMSQEELQLKYQSYLDGVLDFSFQQIITDELAYKKTYEINSVHHKLTTHYSRYSKKFFLPSFLDNHDTSRFLYKSGQKRNKLMSALEIQFQQTQPPIIYYGTESGLTHKKEVSPFNAFSDLQARRPMNWNKPDKELHAFVKELIYMRKELKSKQ